MLKRAELKSDPWAQFHEWFQNAVQSGMKDPDAMILATATPRGVPSARTVLYKGNNSQGLRFYTNYRSRKGKELKKNPYAAIVFYWPSLGRQVRIEGKVKELSPQESDEYWNTRPWESRINSMASPQSSVIPDKSGLEKQVELLKKRLEGQQIPRPKHWGGYCLIPTRFEFWCAGDFRLHDRFTYVKKGKAWQISQLAP